MRVDEREPANLFAYFVGNDFFFKENSIVIADALKSAQPVKGVRALVFFVSQEAN